MSKTTGQPTALQPEDACVCADLGYCADSPNGDVCPVCVRLGDEPCPAGASARDVDATLDEIAAGRFTPSNVWAVDKQSGVHYLRERIDDGGDEEIGVLPRKYIEVAVHGTAPLVLTSDAARKLIRALAAAVSMVDRGAGYAR